MKEHFLVRTFSGVNLIEMTLKGNIVDLSIPRSPSRLLGPINKISCFTSLHSQNAHAAGGYLYLLFNIQLTFQLS